MIQRYCQACRAFRDADHQHDLVDQGRLFGVPYDLQEGERLRDEALERVSSHTDAEYKRAFERVVRDFARQRQSFTSEDVTARVGFPPTAHPNAVGALTRASAMRYGYRKIGRVKATRSNQHATEIALWGPATKEESR